MVKEGEDYSVYSADPDLLVEWKLVEEVRLHAFEAPACPICLHPPTAAKVSSDLSLVTLLCSRPKSAEKWLKKAINRSRYLSRSGPYWGSFTIGLRKLVCL